MSGAERVLGGWQGGAGRGRSDPGLRAGTVLTEAGIRTRVEPGRALRFVVNEVRFSLGRDSLIPALGQLACSSSNSTTPINHSQ